MFGCLSAVVRASFEIFRKIFEKLFEKVSIFSENLEKYFIRKVFVAAVTLAHEAEARACQALRQEHAHDRVFCVHMAFFSLATAGVFLTAPPVDDGRKIDAALFKSP